MDCSNELRTELAHAIGMATREVVDIERAKGGFMVTVHAGPPVFVPHRAADLPAPEPEPQAEAEPAAPAKAAAKPRPAARKK